jgi:hypothetical protein
MLFQNPIITERINSEIFNNEENYNYNYVIKELQNYILNNDFLNNFVKERVGIKESEEKKKFLQLLKNSTTQPLLYNNNNKSFTNTYINTNNNIKEKEKENEKDSRILQEKDVLFWNKYNIIIIKKSSI